MFGKIKPYLPPFLLLSAILSLFWPALLHPFEVLFPTFSPLSDVMVIHWPKANLMVQNWQASAGLPYWSPLSLSGMPLAANQLAMLFYPPAWLFLFLPLEPVFNLLFVFHLFWGGLGIYLLLREGHHLSATAALMGGLTYALNGKLLAHTAGGHVSMIGALAWLPWVVWGFQMWLGGDEKAPRSEGEGEICPSSSLFPRIKWAGLAAIALAMQIVTHTLPVIYSVYVMAAMVVWQITVQRPTFNLRRSTLYVFSLLSILALAGLLGAGQLLPLLELSQASNRALSLSQAAEFALSPIQLLVGLLLPSATAGHEYVIYLGLIPLVLAPFGLTRRHRWTWFYGLLFIFAILFSLGPSTPLHAIFYYLAPGFRWVRTPARMMFVGALALAVLTGFGTDRIAGQHGSKWLTRLTVAIAPLALLVGLGLAFGLGQTGEIRRAALALAIFVPASLLLILLRTQRILTTLTALTGLGLLLFLDLAWFDMSMLRFIPLNEALSPGQAAAQYLAQKPGYFRVYSPSYSLPMQTAAANGLYLADGVEPVHLAAYDQFMARAGGYHDAGFSVTIPKFTGPLETSLKEVEPDLKLLGLLNVTHLVSAFPMNWPGLTLETKIEETFIYRNEQAQPRAWVVHQTVPTETDWLAQLEAMPEVSQVAIVENEGSPPQGQMSQAGEEAKEPKREEIKFAHYSADQIELETEITTPGWLVFSELWYPGWQARVNGAAQPVEKVDGLLRGIYLAQPGRYQVGLEYRPNSVLWGEWISGVTVGLLLLAGLWSLGPVKRGGGKN